MAYRRRAAMFVLGLLVNAVLLFACNAIVGVTDVRARRDSSSGEEEEIPEEEGGELDDGGPVEPEENVLEVALGDGHTCARKPDGTVKCWGDDKEGQTGGGPADGGLVTAPRAVNVTDAVDIAAGQRHTCVARDSGKVACWGYNFDGQLGNGQSGNTSSTPVEVVGISDASRVAAGGNFSCAIRAGGTVACWGANNAGQLGNGTENASLTRVSVVDLKDAISISAGALHACAVRRDGSAVCWGNGINGQLGNGGQARSPKPVAVSNLPASMRIAAGDRSTCALTRDGKIYCWGANDYGQLGNGQANTAANPSPIVVANLNDAKSVWLTRNHACALRKTGAVVCWGQGHRGQLGDGQQRPDASTPQASFVSVSGVTQAIGIGAGGSHSCATTQANAIFCWGANDRGQLGNPTAATTELSPVAVTGYP